MYFSLHRLDDGSNVVIMVVMKLGTMYELLAWQVSVRIATYHYVSDCSNSTLGD